MKDEELKKAYKHLKKDVLMKDVLKSTPPLAFLPNKNLYQSLIRAIVSQQLSTKAASNYLRSFFEFISE